MTEYIEKEEPKSLKEVAKELGGEVVEEVILDQDGNDKFIVEDVAGQKQYIDEDGTRYDKDNNVVLQGDTSDNTEED